MSLFVAAADVSRLNLIVKDYFPDHDNLTREVLYSFFQVFRENLSILTAAGYLS